MELYEIGIEMIWKLYGNRYLMGINRKKYIKVI